MLPTSIVITPGLYPGAGKAVLIRPGQYALFLQNQAIVAGQSSVAFQLERTKSGFYYPVGYSVEFQFSGSPGSFEVDVQTSDTDQDAFFVTNTKVTSASNLNSNFTGRIEMVTYWALYTRLSVPTLANPVNITAKITR